MVRGVQDLVIEDGEIQGKTKTDGMRWSELGGRNFSRSLVGLQGFVGRYLALIAKSKFREITVIVTLPMAMIRLWCKGPCGEVNSHLVIEYL